MKIDRINNEILVNKQEYDKLVKVNSNLKDTQEQQRVRRIEIMEQESNNIRQSKFYIKFDLILYVILKLVYQDLINVINNNYEEEQLQQLYPDIDNMSQEEILKLQEKMGYVNPNNELFY
jgi:hypothetical protein